MRTQQNGPAPRVGTEPHNQRALPSSGNYSTATDRLAYALKLAASGIPVFPCNTDKTPAVAHWKEDSTTDPEQIQKWSWSGLIGVPTGKASGLAVLDVDIDRDKGKDGAAELKAAGLEPPTTQTHHTRRGGFHYLYRHRDGLRNSAGQIATDVDVRGEGGYLIWWPTEGLPVEHEGAIADAPDWMMPKPKPARVASPVASIGGTDRYADRGMKDAIANVTMAADGARNDTLNREALGLYGFALAGRLSEPAITGALTRAASSAGLPDGEIAPTLASARGAAVARPVSSDGRAPGGYIGDAKRTEEIEWTAPQNLPTTLPPVDSFDMALMPDALRDFVADVADRVQCPPDFIGVALVVCLSAIVGRAVGIRPKRHDDWLVIANLWGAIIGRPGIMKTPALSSATAFTGALEARARGAFDEAAKEAEALAMVGKESKKRTEQDIRKALKDGNTEAAQALALQAVNDEPDPPVRKRYKTNDGTIEKLGEVLRDNPRGILVLRDELTGWLRGLDREGREESRAFYLEAWNGDGSFTFDRIGRGTVDIPSTTIAMLGGIQPGPLSGYLAQAHRGGAGDDGLLQRFQLLVWPDVSRDWVNVDRWPETSAKVQVRDVFERLDDLDPASIGAQSDTEFDDNAIPFLHFDDEAQDLFDQWRGDLERKIRSGDELPAIEAHLSKYRSLAPSLALIFHLVDHPGGGRVGRQSLLRALAWCQYLETHARRLYAQITDPAIVAAVELDKHLMAGDISGAFNARDVYRKGWAGLDKEGAWSALQVLEDFHRVARVTHQPSGGGRKSVTWHINPALMEG